MEISFRPVQPGDRQKVRKDCLIKNYEGGEGIAGGHDRNHADSGRVC